MKIANLESWISNYLKTWWTIMLRPIYFYAKLKEDNWQGESLTFLLITAWILAAAATIIVFLLQYVPIGSTLVDGVKGARFILITPVLLTLMFVFFLITLLIIGGLFVSGLFVLFYLVAAALHYIYVGLGGKGHLNRMLQCVFFSSAAFLAGLVIIFLTLSTRYGGLDFSLFRAGFGFIYFLILVFVYGLWAVAGRKVYNISKVKAFAGALAPIIILLIFGFLFDKIALPLLRPWIS